MRRILVSLVFLTLVVGAFLVTRECIVSAADDTKVKKVAVLPFDVHSSENIDYIRNGVWDMLISRISLAGKIEVVSKNDVQDALAKRKGKGNLTVADVYELGKKMGVDYVVHGSITKIGNSVFISTGVFMANDNFFGKFGYNEECMGPTLGDNVSIGVGVILLPNVTIGRGSIIAAGSVVKNDIPDCVLAAGNPAKVITKLPNNWGNI